MPFPDSTALAVLGLYAPNHSAMTEETFMFKVLLTLKKVDDMKIFLSFLMIMLSLNVFAENKMMKMSGSTKLDDLIRGEMAAVKSY